MICQSKKGYVAFVQLYSYLFCSVYIRLYMTKLSMMSYGSMERIKRLAVTEIKKD